MLSPVSHGREAADTALYKVEPYAVCADVYSAPPQTGRGGWTWYTGAAGWMYQAGRGDAGRPSFGGRQATSSAVHPGRMGIVQDPLPLSRDLLSHHRQASRGGRAEGGAAKTKPLIRVALDGGEPDEPGPLPGTIPLVDDRQDHYVDVDLLSEITR